MSEVRVFKSLDDFRAAVGQSLGTSDWIEVTQEMVDGFAEATGDRQWIHIDRERAEGGPFGGTIAHGFLTLSLVPVLTTSIYRLEGNSMIVNYGADNLRFTSPVPTGSRVRASAVLDSLEDGPTTSRAKVSVTVEVEGISKPACVVTVIYVLAPDQTP